MSDKVPLRILCFGDSLTSGFCHHGLSEHPYSHRLTECLVEAFPNRHVFVYTNGEPGDVVSNKPWESRLAAERQSAPLPFFWMHGVRMETDSGC